MEILKAKEIHKIIKELDTISKILNANTRGVSIINETFDIDRTDIDNIVKEALEKRIQELEKRIQEL